VDEYFPQTQADHTQVYVYEQITIPRYVRLIIPRCVRLTIHRYVHTSDHAQLCAPHHPKTCKSDQTQACTFEHTQVHLTILRYVQILSKGCRVHLAIPGGYLWPHPSMYSYVWQYPGKKSDHTRIRNYLWEYGSHNWIFLGT
jgi:hypothetical protein